MEKIEQIEKEQMRLDHPDFGPGDNVKVHVKIRDVSLVALVLLV